MTEDSFSALSFSPPTTALDLTSTSVNLTLGSASAILSTSVKILLSLDGGGAAITGLFSSSVMPEMSLSAVLLARDELRSSVFISLLVLSFLLLASFSLVDLSTSSLSNFY